MLATSLGLLLLLGGALAGPVPDCGPPPAPLNATVPNVLLTRACGDTGALGSFSSCSLQRMWWGPGGRPSPLLPPPGWRPKPGSTGGVHYNARGRRMMGLATASLISQHLPTLHTAKLDDDEGGSTARAVPIKQTRVYTALEGNFSCFRIPAMVALPKAKTILAFAEARGAGLKPGCHDVTAASVVVKRSTDQGTSDGNVCCSCRSSTTFLRGRWRDRSELQQPAADCVDDDRHRQEFKALDRQRCADGGHRPKRRHGARRAAAL